MKNEKKRAGGRKINWKKTEGKVKKKKRTRRQVEGRKRKDRCGRSELEACRRSLAASGPPYSSGPRSPMTEVVIE